jgi:phosphate acetyltransferase
MSFLGQVRKKALQANRRIVLPETSDERVIRAASLILKEIWHKLFLLEIKKL